MSLLDEIRKLITGGNDLDPQQSKIPPYNRIEPAYTVDSPEYKIAKAIGQEGRKHRELLSKEFGTPSRHGVLMSPREDSYYANNPVFFDNSVEGFPRIGLMERVGRGGFQDLYPEVNFNQPYEYQDEMDKQLNASIDTQNMMEQNYDFDPNTPYSTNAQGQGTPYNPIKDRQADVINPANDFTLYADGLNARVDSGYTKDVEKDSMEKTILDRAKEKAEEKMLTEGSPNFISYGQNKPVSDTKPTLSQADVDKMTVNYTNTGEKYTKDNTDVSFLDKVGDFVGNKERMLKLALAFNSMRLEPDQGLATALNDRLKTLSKQGKANSTAEYLRSKGRPDLAELVIKNPELSTQALQEVRQSNKFKIMKGAELESEYGITGLPSKQNFKYNTLTGEISGIGQGNTVIQSVKPDKGYKFEYDDYGNITRQVPIIKELSKDDLKIINEQASAKNISGTVLKTAGDNIADKLFSGDNFLPVTGTGGFWVGKLLGESDARVIRNNVGVLEANASIETLQAMRKQSKTGAALGNVTERELAMLKSSKGALDQAYTQEEFTKAYLSYMNTMFKVVYGDTSDIGQDNNVTAGQRAYEEWLGGVKSKYNLDDNMQRKGDVQTTDSQSQIVDFNDL